MTFPSRLVISPRHPNRLKEALAEIQVFGPWTKKDEYSFVRPEPGLQLHLARVSVWQRSGRDQSLTCHSEGIGMGVGAIEDKNNNGILPLGG